VEMPLKDEVMQKEQVYEQTFLLNILDNYYMLKGGCKIEQKRLALVRM